MKVINYRQFTMNSQSYENAPNAIVVYEQGDIVIRYGDDVEVGVVIQVHSGGEVRTDMFGNECIANIKLATMEQIVLYRPELINYLLMSKYELRETVFAVVHVDGGLHVEGEDLHVSCDYANYLDMLQNVALKLRFKYNKRINVYDAQSMCDKLNYDDLILEDSYVVPINLYYY